MNIQGINPTMYAPVQGQTAMPTTAARPMASSGSSGTSNGLSSGDLQSTFLNLLVTELQNQDPTQPVSPTEMVGQMVSLNQLDQLISINQILGSIAGTSTPATGGMQTANSNVSASSATAAQHSGVPQTAQKVSTSNAALAQAEAAAAAQNLSPVLYPTDLMNLYVNVGAKSNLSIGGR